MPKPKTPSTTKSYYIQQQNAELIEKKAKDCNMSASEWLDALLTEYREKGAK